jgi:hypothetical protein
LTREVPERFFSFDFQGNQKAPSLFPAPTIAAASTFNAPRFAASAFSGRLDNAGLASWR